VMESPPKIDLSKKIRTIWAGTILMITLIIALAASSENGFLQSLANMTLTDCCAKSPS